MHKCILVPNHGAAAGGDTMTALMPQSCPVTAGWPAEPPPPSDRPITLTLVTFGGVRTAPCGGLHYPVCESLFYSGQVKIIIFKLWTHGPLAHYTKDE